ncbi:MFS transporter [Streptomyces sannanensis]|uniref:MFS transporter n=1 Tax=Streptomyces sannanensis TaxID=285536 RepID=A0ABP6SBS6_9ACTN
MTLSASAGTNSRWLGFGVLCTGMFMVITDGTVVNVALPTLQQELEFTQDDLAWVVNAFVIPFGSLLLLSGRLGDLIGRKRMFLIGLVMFTIASALCGLSTDQASLIASRFIQGVGGALATGVILGKLVSLFSDPRELGKAFGIFGFVLTGAGSVGLVLGGFLTEALSWRWIFFINLPIGVAALVIALRVLEDDRGPGVDRRTDFLGAVLMASGLMFGIYTIAKVAEHGWISAHTLGFGAVALLLLAAFVVRESKAAHPLLPLRLFKSRQLSGANAVQGLYVASAFSMFFVGALYLQLVLGYDPLKIGLVFLPMSLVTAFVSLGFAAKLNARFGNRMMLLVGLVPVAGGLALLTRLPVDGTFLVDFLPAMLLLGAGGGLVMPALTALAMEDAPPADAGLAGGLVSTMQQFGGALGVAILAASSTSRTADLLAKGESRQEALTGGYRLAFGITVCFLLGCLAVALTVLRPRRAATANPQATGSESGEPETAAADRS